MKTKQQCDQLYNIMDVVFQSVNASQKSQGSGLTFSYEIAPSKGKDNSTVYNFSVTIREAGYGEKKLQTIPFTKPKSLDKYMMEAQILLSMLTIFTENTCIQWNELGKMLITDSELQEKAKKV